MTEETPKTTSKKPEAPPERDHAATKHSVDVLVSDAGAMLGVAPHVVAGALATGNKQSYTLEDAKAAVESFLGRDVKSDPAE